MQYITMNVDEEGLKDIQNISYMSNLFKVHRITRHYYQKTVKAEFFKVVLQFDSTSEIFRAGRALSKIPIIFV